MVRPFVKEESFKVALDRLLDTSQYTIANHKFHKNNLFEADKNKIKVCPLCFESDKKEFGTAYIHRSHNAIGIKTCHIHSCYLDEIGFNKSDIDKLLDINDIYIPEKVNYPDEDLIYHHDELSNNVHHILNGVLGNITKEELSIKIKTKLFENEVFKTIDSINHPVIKSFFEKYSNGFLEVYESEASIENCKRIRDILNRGSKEQNYLRQILVLQVLFGNLEEMITTDDEFLFFGDAPFPCLNITCENYMKDVIKECSITSLTSLKPVIGSFKCDCCNFVY